MPVTLSSEQLDILRAHHDAGDRIAYYSALEAFGISYGSLALAGVLNNSIAGATANAFLTDRALDGIANTNLLARIGTALMEADYTARLRASGADLQGTDISDYHEEVITRLTSADNKAWTPYLYLDTFERPGAFNAAWAEMLNAGNFGTWQLISNRRDQLVAQYHQTNPATAGFGVWELENMSRSTLLAAGFDAAFLDWFEQYTQYIEYLSSAGLGSLDGISSYFASNDYGNYNISGEGGLGHIIGGDAGNNGLGGSAGNDVTMGFSGDDTITGSSGDDRIYGNGGDDLVDYSQEAGPLRIELGALQDTGNNQIFTPMAGSWSIQRVINGNDLDILIDVERITATSGNDTLSLSGSLENILQLDAVAYGGIDLGGAGSAGDTLDLSLLSRSASIILGNDRAEIHDGWTPSNFATVYGAENIVGTGYSDDIKGNQGANQIEGGDGADIIRGGVGGGDTLDGGAGADRLYYTDGEVTLEGGEGNDYYDFSEATGNDRGATIVLSGAFDHDMLSRYGSSMNWLIFSDLNFADVDLKYDYTISGPYDYGYDTYFLFGSITITAGNDKSIYIPNISGQYTYAKGDIWTGEGHVMAVLQSPFIIEFADRTFEYWEQMFSTPIWEIPRSSTPATATTALEDHEEERNNDRNTANNDTIIASKGDDIIRYTSGDDLIRGRGPENKGYDTLDLSSFSESDVTFSISGHDMLIETSAGTLRLEYQLRYDIGHERSNIERLLLADGVILDEAGMKARALADQATGGDDLITGTIQSDTLSGGAGNDTLIGAKGNDTFIFESGDDLIRGRGPENMGLDMLDLSSFAASDVTFSVSGYDMLIETSAGTLRLEYQLRYDIGHERSNIERLLLADDVILDEAGMRTRALTDSLELV